MSTIRKKFFKSTSKSESNTDSTKSNTRRELKFTPLDTKGFATQATYKQVKDALLVAIDERITDDLIDVRSCIENETTAPPKEPVKVPTVGATDEERKDSRDRNRILYESALKKWDCQIYNLEINLLKVRSMIWDKFTSRTMKDKLEPLSDFSAKLSRDPVALLLAIKVQMHDTVRAQYCKWTRITATEKLFSFRQQDLTLADYITHFKELRDIFVTQNGNGFNDTYVADTVENFTALDDY